MSNSTAVFTQEDAENGVVRIALLRKAELELDNTSDYGLGVQMGIARVLLYAMGALGEDELSERYADAVAQASEADYRGYVDAEASGRVTGITKALGELPPPMRALIHA